LGEGLSLSPPCELTLQPSPDTRHPSLTSNTPRPQHPLTHPPTHPPTRPPRSSPLRSRGAGAAEEGARSPQKGSAGREEEAPKGGRRGPQGQAVPGRQGRGGGGRRGRAQRGEWGRGGGGRGQRARRRQPEAAEQRRGPGGGAGQLGRARGAELQQHGGLHQHDARVDGCRGGELGGRS